MENELIKIDRNGSKHWRGRVTCDRCGGDGIYKWGAVINGRAQYAGVCFKCNGCGWVIDEWIERTPEYQAKLDAKREARHAAQQAKWEAEQAAREAERKAREAEREAKLAALRAISQYVGEVGNRINTTCTYVGSPSYERKSFAGYGTETVYIHRFKDAAGNLMVWKTTRYLGLEEGATVTLTGTVKEHSEYNTEKQTILQRCKVVDANGV